MAQAVSRGLPPRRPGSVSVGFVVDKVALGQVLLRVLRLSPGNSFHRCSMAWKNERTTHDLSHHHWVTQEALRLRCCRALHHKKELHVFPVVSAPLTDNYFCASCSHTRRLMQELLPTRCNTRLKARFSFSFTEQIVEKGLKYVPYRTVLTQLLREACVRCGFLRVITHVRMQRDEWTTPQCTNVVSIIFSLMRKNAMQAGFLCLFFPSNIKWWNNSTHTLTTADLIRWYQ
jgi:hypothetical protein